MKTAVLTILLLVVSTLAFAETWKITPGSTVTVPRDAEVHCEGANQTPKCYIWPVSVAEGTFSVHSGQLKLSTEDSMSSALQTVGKLRYQNICY
jgi:hypothetical protein